jgi:hypothetical protein
VEPDDVEPDDVEPDDVEPDGVEPDDVEPDGVEHLFQSLKEKASGNTRVDDLVEDILKVELSRLEDSHESAMTTWKGQSADQVKQKQAEGAVTITMSVMGKLSEKSTKVEKDIRDMLRKEHEALKKLTQSTYARKLVTEGKLTDLTNQIVTAKQELKDFKASRNRFETAEAASKKEHSDALTQIDSLNRETGSLEEKIKELKEQNDALAKIKLNEKILVGLFAEPIELEPSLTLIEAIESELSITTNSLNIVEALINNRETKLKGDVTKLRNLNRRKGELRKITEGTRPINEKLATYQELDTTEKQLKVLQVAIDAIAHQLNEKDLQKFKLLATQAHLEESLAFLKPGPPPPPTDKIVLIPQGDNISQCAFIVKEVPPQEKKSLFRKPSEYSKFIKFHNEQVARLQKTMPAVNYLKEGSGAKNPENNEKRLEELFANALIESSQASGAAEATLDLEATGLSGKLIVYGYARSESGTMEIYVRELDSKPARVPLESGIAPDFPSLKKK